jgi:hypothetical protein
VDERRDIWAMEAYALKAFSTRCRTYRDKTACKPGGMFGRLTDDLPGGRRPPFDFVVVDGAHGITVHRLRFLAALDGGRPNSLFFAGDLSQRILQQAISGKSLGVDVRRRSRTLQVNYRTSHQLRARANRLLGPDVTDVDGNKDDRRGHRCTVHRPTAVGRDAACAAG